MPSSSPISCCRSPYKGACLSPICKEPLDGAYCTSCIVVDQCDIKMPRHVQNNSTKVIWEWLASDHNRWKWERNTGGCDMGWCHGTRCLILCSGQFGGGNFFQFWYRTCKGYCGRARRRAGCRVERGTSRGSEVFSLLCNDRLNRSAYLAGDPKRKG